MEEAARCFAGPQDEGAERRAQRHCVHGRKAERDAHGDRELGVDGAHHAAVEHDRHVDGDHNQSGGDQCSGELFHSLHRRVEGGEVLLIDQPGAVFGDADGVVHHRADHQNQREHGQGIDAHVQEIEEEEGADQRYRNRDRRNDRRAPVLQEEVGDHHHQDEGEDQRFDDFLHRDDNEPGRVVTDLPGQPVGKVLLEFFERFVDVLHNLQRVGIVQFKDGQRDGRTAVEGTGAVVGFGAEFHLGDVAEPDLPPVFTGFDDDAFELLRGAQPALGVDLELHPAAARFGADRTGGRLDVLAGDCVADVVVADGVGAHLVGVEPDADAVLLFAENDGLADSVDSRDGVLDVDADVVAQKERCMFRIVAVKRIGRKHVAGAFHDGETVVDHVGRQGVLGPFDRVVDVDQRHVFIGAGFEGQSEGVVAEVVRLRGVVDHVLDAVDLRLQRGGDGVGDHLGARARVGCHDHDGRRRDLRIFRDRQPVDRDDSRQHEEERDHQRKPGPPDENC